MVSAKGKPFGCYIFMKGPTAAALSLRIALKSKSHLLQNEGIILLYSEAINYRFNMYAMKDVVAKTYFDMMQYTGLSDKYPTKYTILLWHKAFLSNTGHGKYVLMGIFIE